MFYSNFASVNNITSCSSHDVADFAGAVSTPKPINCLIWHWVARLWRNHDVIGCSRGGPPRIWGGWRDSDAAAVREKEEETQRHAGCVKKSGWRRSDVASKFHFLFLVDSKESTTESIIILATLSNFPGEIFDRLFVWSDLLERSRCGPHRFLFF